MHIFDIWVLANFQNFLLNCNHSAIKSSILNVNMKDDNRSGLEITKIKLIILNVFLGCGFFMHIV